MSITTIHQWRSNPQLVSAAKKSLDSATVQQMLQTLRATNPAPSLPLCGAQPNDFTYNYGIIIGWQTCLATLQSLSDPIQAQVEPASEFTQSDS